MSRQLLLHMLEEDSKALFEHLGHRDDLLFADWAASTPEIVASTSMEGFSQNVAIWSRRSEPAPTRKLVTRNDGSTAFVFDWGTETVDFVPSKMVSHGGVPALMQGRLYCMGSSSESPAVALVLLARKWARSSFEVCPFKLLGGYVGPSAMSWHRAGGLLLPMFNPPPTSAWEEFFGRQH